MEDEIYENAKSLFKALYLKANSKLLEKKKAGEYTEEEYYDLNKKLINYIAGSIHLSSFLPPLLSKKNWQLQESLGKELWYVFDVYNNDTIEHLTNSYQQEADKFCDEKEIPRVKVMMGIVKGIAVPKLSEKGVILERSTLLHDRKYLENALNHELRHHLLISKYKLSKPLGSIGHVILSLGLLTAGYAFHNSLVYNLGTISWTTELAIEMYADLPRRKTMLVELGMASVPWIVKLLTNI
jgi:hypothetical protein